MTMKRTTIIAAAAALIAMTVVALGGGTVITQPIGQKRITGTCVGQVLVAINANGSVVCETDDDTLGPDGDKGDITVGGAGTTLAIDNTAVTYSKIQNVAGLSVVGRSANTSGVAADLTAGNDGDVLRRSGTSLGFGAIPVASVTGALSTSNVSGTSGRSARFTSTDAVGNGAASDDGTNLSAAADNSYLSWDYNGGDNRLGVTKKAGYAPKLTYGNATTFAIAQSSAIGITAASTFTDRLTIDSKGAMSLGDTGSTSVDDSVTALTVANTGTLASGASLVSGGLFEYDGAINTGSPTSGTARTNVLVDINSHPDATCNLTGELLSCDPTKTATNVALRLRASNDTVSGSAPVANYALRVESGLSYFASNVETDGALDVATSLDVGGTLSVTGTGSHYIGGTTINGTTGDVAINTNKFNVTASSGNTTIAGTLGVTGVTTATGGISSIAAANTWGDERGTVNSPVSAIGYATNNYDCGANTRICRVSSGASASITGIAGGVNGRFLTIINTGPSYGITITSEDAGSTAANRFALPSNDSKSTQYLYPGCVMTLVYDGTSSRWRMESANSCKIFGSQRFVDNIYGSALVSFGDAVSNDGHLNRGSWTAYDDAGTTVSGAANKGFMIWDSAAIAASIGGALNIGGLYNSGGSYIGCQLKASKNDATNGNRGYDLLFSCPPNTSTASVTTYQWLTSTGHLDKAGADPTLTSCGTSPTIVGDDTAGVVTIGTGGTATDCVVTFANAYTATPSCVVTSLMSTRTDLYLSALSSTAFTLSTTAATAWPASGKFSYLCIGVR